MSAEATASMIPIEPSTPASATPTAIATTKRKFHKLLEGLTRSTPSSTADSRDSPAKRIRLEARARLETKSRSYDPRTTYIETQVLKGRLAAAAPNAYTETAEEPNYVPWSHGTFLKRLKTFADVRLWSSKPEAVNEVAWAKRGWVCVERNTVACRGGCEQRVVVGLRAKLKDEDGRDVESSEDFTAEVSEELVKRYVELVVMGHKEDCLWRREGYVDDIFRLPIARPSTWQPQLKERYSSLAKAPESLPPVERLDQPFDIPQTISSLPPDLLRSETTPQKDSSTSTPTPNETETSTDISHTALAFALCGWQAHPDSSRTMTIATCDACFRRLGLWLYTYAARASTENDAEENETGVNLLDNHRSYCPWINGHSQSMPGSLSGLPAWEILQRSIDNFADSVETRRSLDSVDSAAEPTIEAIVDMEGGTPRKDRATLEKEDKARFAKLKALQKSFGLDKIRKRKPDVPSTPSPTPAPAQPST